MVPVLEPELVLALESKLAPELALALESELAPELAPELEPVVMSGLGWDEHPKKAKD